jgi:hypothetical protein
LIDSWDNLSIKKEGKEDISNLVLGSITSEFNVELASPSLLKAKDSSIVIIDELTFIAKKT